MSPVLEAQALVKTYGRGATAVRALDKVDLAVPRGQFVAVMGPSGCGKSTLLNLLGALDTPDEGTIRIGGTPLDTLDDDGRTVLRRRRLGFVFQFFNLLPTFSAVENVALPLQLDGMAEAEALRRAQTALERVGIGERRDHRPSQLSGGEQQRAAIARALVFDPELLLADEPTGNLDSATGDRVMALLRELVDEGGKTIVMVTHDARYGAMADRLIRLRDGRIEDDTLGGAAPEEGA